MKVLLIHNEAHFFGGAERTLGYFLAGINQNSCAMHAAMAAGKMTALIPAEMPRIFISDSDRLSPGKLWRQAKRLQNLHQEHGFDLVHAWAAREWELAALFGRLTGCPAIGTLHDHPQAWYISKPRQLLMSACARWGLCRVVCVSGAVKQACIQAHYPVNKLEVICNGLPGAEKRDATRGDNLLRLGYLGGFSTAKGFRGLFAIMDHLSELSSAGWELWIAGAPAGAVGQQLISEIKLAYSNRAWWNRISWKGWIEDPLPFLASLDLLIFPSVVFDSLPNVILEAGHLGIPVVAARVGGVEEIVEDKKTGWLFKPENWHEAAEIISPFTADPASARANEDRVLERMRKAFSVTNMIEKYLRLYSTILVHV